MGMRKVALFCLLSALAVSLVQGYTHQEKVPIFVNKVGPYGNPTETYSYYSLPFCQPQEIQEEGNTLGHLLTGDRKAHSLYDIRFAVGVDWRSLCSLTLNEEQLEQFREAIRNNYFFEFFVDDLPVFEYVGVKEVNEVTDEVTELFLNTHINFDLGYNGDKIVWANITVDPSIRLPIKDRQVLQVEFSFSVRWTPTDFPFENRFDVYSSNSIAAHAYEIHWLSIINSFVLVMLLSGFLALILIRVIRKDLAQAIELQAEEDMLSSDESGWKLLHGDVFRFPPLKSAFASIIGAGSQILVLGLVVVLLGSLGSFYGSRGTLITAAIALYAVTAGLGGYISSYVYISLGGLKWAWNIILTSCLFPAPLFVVWAFLNTVALIYSSTAALPFSTILVILLTWALLTLPLTIAGGIFAKKHASVFEPVSRVNKIPREIPALPWWKSAYTQVLMAGVLPFSAIYIELHYIFSSVWGHNMYSLYSILCLAFLLLILVTACSTVALIFFQLNSEDHRWWWRSVLCGGSVGLLVYLYSFFYFHHRSGMTGFMQTSFFFGYMLILSFACFLMMAVVGFFSSFFFIKYIYSAIKSD
eukprot:GILI01015742.1.p1 GENE.GILI01015742.1~~GILI01015742.1.p1  ORF type:complete len:585 (+),score=186.98 GILI01015742.1:31-1785(+)